MSKFTLAIPATISNRLCAGCPMLRRCQSERLWRDVLPCEAVLDFEVGIEYETDASLPYWVMPIEVRVNVEAMG